MRSELVTAAPSSTRNGAAPSSDIFLRRAQDAPSLSRGGAKGSASVPQGSARLGPPAEDPNQGASAKQVLDPLCHRMRQQSGDDGVVARVPKLLERQRPGRFVGPESRET